MKLRQFLIIRLIMIIPTIFLLVTLVFFVMHIVPGDPVEALMGDRAGSDEQIEIIRHKLGLDRPIHVQYLDYMAKLIRLDFGNCYITNRPVIREILSRFPATIELSLLSALFGIPLGIYLGTTAGKREGGKKDATIRISVLLRYSIPIFYLGIMLQILVVQYVPFLPLSGRLSPRITLEKITGLYLLDSILSGNMVAFVDVLKHFFLPVICLGTSMAASLSRIVRVNLIEVLREEYIRTVRLKGCPEKIVFKKHALPNALIPILTYAGMQIAWLLSGSIMTETTFSWPGIGRLIVYAVSYRDFNLIQGCIVFLALIICLVNFLVDVFYAIIDPRVSY